MVACVQVLLYSVAVIEWLDLKTLEWHMQLLCPLNLLLAGACPAEHEFYHASVPTLAHHTSATVVPAADHKSG